MSDFDFLQNATIGQYIPTESILHRIEPRAKIIGFGALILAITFSPSPIGIAIGLATTLFGLVIARIPLKFALKRLTPPLPFLIIIAGIQIFLFPNAGHPILFTLGSIRISLASIWSGILLILRFSALILTLSLMSFCLSNSELIHGMQQILSPLNRIGIHTMDLIMIIQVTFRFLPILAQSAERIAKAQASRGAEWGVKSRGLLSRVKQIIPLIIPLFVTSLRRTETMALAMDARAYGYKANRTSMFEYSFSWSGAIFLLIVFSIAVAILFV
ncbi:MAG: energy-coupling factor transporter transmembrane component T [Anaerolineaceae bacterium]